MDYTAFITIAVAGSAVAGLIVGLGCGWLLWRRSKP